MINSCARCVNLTPSLARRACVHLCRNRLPNLFAQKLSGRAGPLRTAVTLAPRVDRFAQRLDVAQVQQLDRPVTPYDKRQQVLLALLPRFNEIHQHTIRRQRLAKRPERHRLERLAEAGAAGGQLPLQTFPLLG